MQGKLGCITYMLELMTETVPVRSSVTILNDAERHANVHAYLPVFRNEQTNDKAVEHLR